MVVHLTCRRRDFPNISQRRQFLLWVPARKVQSVLRPAKVLDGELAVLRYGGASGSAAGERTLAGVRPVRRTAGGSRFNYCEKTVL